MTINLIPFRHAQSGLLASAAGRDDSRRRFPISLVRWKTENIATGFLTVVRRVSRLIDRVKLRPPCSLEKTTPLGPSIYPGTVVSL